MFTLKNPWIHAPSERPTDGNPPALLIVVGSDAEFEGKLDIADSIQIDCSFGGELKVGGKLVIGERGSVHADVQTVDAIIRGEYEGKMVATGSVEVTATAQVHGSIETNTLVISKGGVFNGNVVKLKESGAKRGTGPVSAVKEMGEEVLSERPNVDGDPDPGDQPGRGDRAAARDQGSGDTLCGAGAGHTVEEVPEGRGERGGEHGTRRPRAGTPERRGRVRAGAQAGAKRKGKTSHDHDTMVTLKESGAKRGTPPVSAVKEMADPLHLPLLQEEMRRGQSRPDGDPHAGEQPGRGGGGAGRDQGSGDTVHGAGAGHAVEEVPEGRGERGGEPEPGGPLAGTSERRGRVRAGAQAGPKRQGNSSHDPSEDKETSGPGVMDQAAPARHPETAAPTDPTAEGQTLEEGTTLFTTASAPAPIEPTETSPGWQAGLRSSTLVVRLEGPRMMSTEHKVTTVSGTILGDVPVRLVLYVNDTSREVATEDGSFRVTVPLQRGLNHLRVVATDRGGAESEDNISVVSIPPEEDNKRWRLPWPPWTRHGRRPGVG